MDFNIILMRIVWWTHHILCINFSFFVVGMLWRDSITNFTVCSAFCNARSFPVLVFHLIEACVYFHIYFFCSFAGFFRCFFLFSFLAYLQMAQRITMKIQWNQITVKTFSSCLSSLHKSNGHTHFLVFTHWYSKQMQKVALFIHLYKRAMYFCMAIEYNLITFESEKQTKRKLRSAPANNSIR